MRIPEIHRLVKSQQAQIVGQIRLVRHLPPAHQNRNHAHPPFERLGNLHAHVVVSRIKPAASIDSSACQPPFTDHSKERIALTDLVLDYSRKIVAALDRVEVHVYVLFAEMDAEDVEQSTRISTAVFTAIADEYSRHIRPQSRAFKSAHSLIFTAGQFFHFRSQVHYRRQLKKSQQQLSDRNCTSNVRNRAINVSRRSLTVAHQHR